MRRLLLVTALLTALVVLAVGCGEDEDEGTPTPAAGGVEAPARIKQAGKLVAGSDISYPPLEFFKEGTQEAQGFDYDLGVALAQAMGVGFEMVNTAFDGIIPALNAGRFDVILSAMTVTDERSQAIDFVPYLKIGTGVLVPKGNPQNIQTLDDLCGKKVSVDLATVQVDQIAAQNEKCKTAGTPEAQVSTFEKDPDAVQALVAGRNDAHLLDYPVAVYYSTLPDQAVQSLTIQHETAPYGIGVRKDDPELKAALEKALQALIGNGTYGQLLAKWALQPGSIVE